MGLIPHPLQHLTFEETKAARDIIIKCHANEIIEFREIGVQEPSKAELLKFLELEHQGQLKEDSPRPSRLARCHYDTIGSDRTPRYNESLVDLNLLKRVGHEIIPEDISPALTM